MCWKLVFDGGSKGNPGPGYGSYCIRTPGGVWGEPVRCDFGADMTNNEAEYRALIEGLAGLAEACDPARCSVIVYGDSQLVLRQVMGVYRTRKAHLKPLNSKAREASGRFKRVDFEWWPRERSVELLGH